MNDNILNWYPFTKDPTILYIEKEKNEKIRHLLNEKAKKITILTLNENVDIVRKIVEIKEKYDYIIMLGVLENANEIIKEENAEIKLMKFAKEQLNENGKILLAVDNRLGAKYIVGNKSEYCNKIYDSIKNEYKKYKMFSRAELDKIIENINFKYRKNYYPLPDYKNANVIYTDEALPQVYDSKINYNVIYEEGSLIVQDETMLLKQFIKEGDFIKYTNSYFIELSDSKIDNDIKYVSFNNMRKDKYSLILKISKEMVEKSPRTEEAIEHIRNINENNYKLKELGFEIAEEIENQENSIKSPYINLPLLDNYIYILIKQSKKDEVYKIIDEWFELIKNKLDVDENGNIKHGFIDLVFENTFYDSNNNKFIFFDQEWYMENIKANYILYRAINNLYIHNPNLSNYIPKEELMKKYDLLDDIEFEKIEIELQKDVIDEEKKKFYGKQYDYRISSEELKKIIEDIKKFDEDNQKLIKEVEQLKKMSLYEFIKRKIKG